MDALLAVEDRVRDGVRTHGIDPQLEPDAVRALVDDAVADVVAEWVSRDLDMLLEPVEIARHAFDAVAGFGPLQPFFDDPLVEELWINDPGRVFVARNGRSELTTVVLTADQVRDLVERMLRQSGRRLDLSSPFVDAMLPDGSRLHVAIPDITRRHWAVNVRRFVVRPRHVSDLVATGSLTTQASAFLDAAVVSGLNIVVAGGTQSGKTTFVNALLGCVPAHERIVSCEEVFELRLEHPDWVGMQTRDASLEGTGEVPLRRLVREALRMRPTRLIVGEVRQAESLDLLVAMNSGMPSMATLHANSAREAVTKLCTLPLLAGQNIASDFVVPTVAGCVDLVVHLATERSGARRVREIAALPGRVEAGVIEMADIFVDHGSGLQRGRGLPPHEQRFCAHGYDLAELLGRGE
ncbi:MAG: ATPase, T2SS/T4P/T4SS family [Actinomycetes bacterium]